MGDVIGKANKGFRTLKEILPSFEESKDKFISREWQAYGVTLAKELGDLPHKALYIKMARDYPRNVLEVARQFVSDAKARSKGRLFMWKVKELLKTSKQTEVTDKS